MNILKKISAPKLLQFGKYSVLKIGRKRNGDSIKKKLINDKGVRRTAASTLSLLISWILVEQSHLNITYREAVCINNFFSSFFF